MSGRNMQLDVLVRLKDLLSSPLRGMRRHLDGFISTMKRLGSIARNMAVIGAGVAAISFMGPMQEAAAFQQKLLDIAGTQNLVKDGAFAAVNAMKKQYEGLSFKVGIDSDTIATGAGQMIAAGLDKALVDGSLLDIGRATKAANAEFSDMASVATSLMQTLRLPVDDLNGALAGLVVAGKEGAFELKDMARYFPTLTSQMNKLGLTGRGASDQLAAMLQIARKGTADPAEAANNLKNFLDKITAPETIKRFSDLGVDIGAVMKDATIKGINPIEAVVQKTMKLTKITDDEISKLMKNAKANGLQGADALAEVQKQITAIHGAGKLGELFADQQVMGFLMPMLANIEEYKRVLKEVNGAGVSVIDDDFDTQMKSINSQMTLFMETFTQIKREFGMAAAPWLETVNGYLITGLDLFRQWNETSDGMAGDMVAIGGGVAAFGAALATLGIVVPILVGGFKALVSPLRLVNGLFRGMSGAGAGIGGIANDLERVNAAATRAGRIQRPSIWSMVFGATQAISMINDIPSEPEELKKFMEANRKRSEGWNQWLETNVGSPRSWLGLNDNDATKPIVPDLRNVVQLPKTMPDLRNIVPQSMEKSLYLPIEIEPLGTDALKATINDLTKGWPLAAQLGMKDYQNALINGGSDAKADAMQIGQNIKDMLQITAGPTVDTSSLERAIKLSDELAAKVRGLTGMAPAGVGGKGPLRDPSGAVAPAVSPTIHTLTPQSASKAELNGNLSIGLAPGLIIKQAQTDAPGVAIQTGRAVGRA